MNLNFQTDIRMHGKLVKILCYNPAEIPSYKLVNTIDAPGFKFLKREVENDRLVLKWNIDHLETCDEETYDLLIEILES